MVRYVTKEKKRKKKEKDGNKTEMNESHKVQLKSRNALINILKFSTQICCYEASLVYYCYYCSCCCWTGSSCPCLRMCTCHSVVQNSLSDFLFGYTELLLPRHCWPCGAHEKYQPGQWRDQVRVWKSCHMLLRKHINLSPKLPNGVSPLR